MNRIQFSTEAIIKRLSPISSSWLKDGPFFKKDKRFYARFDEMKISQTSVRFFWKGEEIAHYDSPVLNPGDTLTITGINMETEVSVSSA